MVYIEKNRSVGQIIEKAREHSWGQNFGLIMILAQIDYPDKVKIKFEYRLCGVKK